MRLRSLTWKGVKGYQNYHYIRQGIEKIAVFGCQASILPVKKTAVSTLSVLLLYVDLSAAGLSTHRRTMKFTPYTCIQSPLRTVLYCCCSGWVLPFQTLAPV